LQPDENADNGSEETCSLMASGTLSTYSIVATMKAPMTMIPGVLCATGRITNDFGLPQPNDFA
jgi:hypothetical protein